MEKNREEKGKRTDENEKTQSQTKRQQEGMANG